MKTAQVGEKLFLEQDKLIDHNQYIDARPGLAGDS
jgi:hypothetical protein